MYYKLARKEEQETLKKYPEQYRKYMQQTPVFFPKLSELAAVNKRKP
jgi:protein-S-isoprenylcysteine O-methyltransferase Ste14